MARCAATTATLATNTSRCSLIVWTAQSGRAPLNACTWMWTCACMLQETGPVTRRACLTYGTYARRMVSSSSTSVDRSLDAVTCVVHKPTTVRVTCYVYVFAFVQRTLHVVRTSCRHSETPARLYSGSREAQLISARPRLFATLSLSLRDIRCCLYTGRGPVSRMRPLYAVTLPRHNLLRMRKPTRTHALLIGGCNK